MIAYLAFILPYSVPHLFFFWCFGKAVIRDGGVSGVSSLTFKQNTCLITVRIGKWRTNVIMIVITSLVYVRIIKIIYLRRVDSSTTTLFGLLCFK